MKLNRDMIDQVEKLLPIALNIDVVGDYLGVPGYEWGNWLERGEKQLSRISQGKKPAKTEAIYLELYRTYRKGMAKGEMRHVAVISEAAKTDPRAAEWLLERRLPERWGKMEKVDDGPNNLALFVASARSAALQDENVLEAHYGQIESNLMENADAFPGRD